MTILAKDILDKAVVQLTDLAGIRWTRAELLGWVSDGQRAITSVQPNANNKVVSMQLVAGSRQTIPSDGWMLLDIYHYMGTDGQTPGRVVRLISRELLDSFDLYWHSATPSPEPKNFIYDLQAQRTFYVYPPNTGTGWLRLNYSQIPPVLTSENDEISVIEIYQPALLDYVLFRACSKDAEYAPGVALAQMYMQSFTALIGGKDAAERGNNPNQALMPHNPNIPGSES